MTTEGQTPLNKERLCRVCKVPLVPPDPHRKYRTIKCNRCAEVTPVGPPPPDKKYVLCTCNALLIVPDDASLFTCTRCKKIRRAVEVQTPREDGLTSSHSQATLTKTFSTGFGMTYASSVGTVRNALFRTVSVQNEIGGGDLETPAVALEAVNGTVTPKTSPSYPNFRMGVEGADDIEFAETKLNDDQQYIVDFFAARVRPSVVKYISGEKFWWMRLKILLFIMYNVAISVLVISDVLEHWFWKQFGFRTYDDWLAIVVFVWYIASFSIEWIFNKIFIYGYMLMCMWFGLFALFDPLKRAFFWNFYDTGHLLEEVMIRCFYLRIPGLQIPFYRFLNPPQNSQIESEFFFLSDIHLISLVYQHPRVHKFFKFWLVIAIIVKTLGKAACIVALILLPFNWYTVIYAAETFLSTVWTFFMYFVTNKKASRL